MCGISGFCSFNTDFLTSDKYLKTLKDMRSAIAHRGHDQTGEYLRKNVGLSHTRLSIRDLSNGVQPMIKTDSFFEFTIVFNGEIYNTDELFADLSTKYQFKTTCDTEAILYAYMKYGADCVNHLNGIFAFAIWDSLKQQLFLARDHLGVKPLFFTLIDGQIIFASEIKALFAHQNVKPQVSLDSFREIFGVGPARTSGNGVFDGIYELKAGQSAIFNHDGLKFQTYWDLQSHEHLENYKQTVEKTRFLVTDSITKQMISDVPVCSFLSGGIDSSIITAIAAKVLQKDGATLNTYSFDFVGNDKHFKGNSFQPERDKPYVDIMLEHVKSNHTYLECEESELANLLYDAMISKDLPGMADVDASLLYFCKIVKSKNKVALTGECADEIFGGYPWFYREDLLMGDGFPWSKDLSMRTLLLRDDFAKKLDISSYVREQYKETLSDVPKLAGETSIEAKRREITYLNIKWFMQTLLDRMDRTSMNSGLEARVPFADYRIMEYVFNVPWSMKRKDNVEKSLLRDAFRDILPYELLYRKKSPYPKTYDPRYEQILREKLYKIINDKNAPVHEIIDKNKVLEFFEGKLDYDKPWFGQLMSGPQLVAYILQINDWLIKYNPKIKL